MSETLTHTTSPTDMFALSRPYLPRAATTPMASDASRPSPPRRSSSLHKAMITKLRPLPFQYVWAVWHSKPDEADDYVLTQLADRVADIGAFYRVFNNLPWSEVRSKDSIHIFRTGVKPLWEDEENREGGRWLIRVRAENGKAVRLWEEICLLCCGGELQAIITQEHDHVLGMSFSPRFNYTHISVWTKKGENLRSIMLLERAILAGLSPDLRPKSEAEYNYRKHAQKLEWHSMVKQSKLPGISEINPYIGFQPVRSLAAK